MPESIFFTDITTQRGLRVLKDLYHPNSKYLEYEIGEPRKPVVEDIEEDDAKDIGNVAKLKIAHKEKGSKNFACNLCEKTFNRGQDYIKAGAYIKHITRITKRCSTNISSVVNLSSCFY